MWQVEEFLENKDVLPKFEGGVLIMCNPEDSASSGDAKRGRPGAREMAQP